MWFFLTLITSLIAFLLFNPLLGNLFAGIISVIVFIAMYFHKDTLITGSIKSNMKTYFYYRNQGLSHDASLSKVIQNRPGINSEDILKSMAKTNISMTVDTEKEALENLVYLILCHENGIPPKDELKKKIYKKMNLVYTSFSKKYGVEDKKIIYTELLEKTKAINFIKNIIDCYNFYRKKAYPHDVAIEMAIENIFSNNEAKIPEIMANFTCLNILISSVGGFKKALYGRNLNDFKGPFEDIVEKGKGMTNTGEAREAEVIADNLRDFDYSERDLKILIFTIYDFLYPVKPDPEIYEKRIKQINEIYNSLEVFN